MDRCHLKQPRGRSFALWTALVGAVVLTLAGQPYLLEEYQLGKLIHGDAGEQAAAVEWLGEARSARAVEGLLEYLAQSAKRSGRVRSTVALIRKSGGPNGGQFRVSQFLELDGNFVDPERGDLIRRLFTALSEADLVDLFGRVCLEGRSGGDDITCRDGILFLSTQSREILERTRDVFHVMNECYYGDPDVLRARLALSRIGSKGLRVLENTRDDPTRPAGLRAVAWLQQQSLRQDAITQ